MITFLRIIKYGLQNTIRTLAIAQATVWITSFTLITISSLLIFNVLIREIVEKLKSQVDLTITLKKAVDEDDVLKLKRNLESMPQITRVDYIPREKIYEEARTSQNPIIEQSLEVLEGENPYLSQLTVKTKDPTFLASLNEFVEQNYKALIDKINYSQNKDLINRVSSFIDSLKKGGFIITLILGILVVLVTLNTIRLAIYSLREEIQIMRLVGASNFFIQGPFFVEAVIYAIISAILSSVTLLVILKFISLRYSFILFDFDPYKEYAGHFLWYFITQVIIGILLAIISTYLAMRKYLKI